VRTSRLEAFSDGVLAIIITIMVLELKIPGGHDLASLRQTAGSGLLSYLLSFVYVGIYWNNHHHMFQLVDRVTGGVLWANLGLLFFLSLFPFTTAWMNHTDFARDPVLVYGLNLLLAAVAYYVLQSVIIRSQGRDSLLRQAVGRDVKGKASMVLYVAGICCGLPEARAWTWVALGWYVATAVMWVVPDRRIDRFVRDHGMRD
jgi:TMEM175 potassium channel family protein